MRQSTRAVAVCLLVSQLLLGTGFVVSLNLLNGLGRPLDDALFVARVRLFRRLHGSQPSKLGDGRSRDVGNGLKAKKRDAKKDRGLK